MALSADYEYKLSSHHGAPMRKVQKITLINKRLHFESLSRIPARANAAPVILRSYRIYRAGDVMRSYQASL